MTRQERHELIALLQINEELEDTISQRESELRTVTNSMGACVFAQGPYVIGSGFLGDCLLPVYMPSCSDQQHPATPTCTKRLKSLPSKTMNIAL